MSLAHAPAIPPHPFAPSGRRERGVGGRTYEICATCGRRQIGTAHGRVPTLKPYQSGTPRMDRRARRAPVRKPELVAATPRELVSLALMLDAVIELPPEIIGWRVHLRSQELRKAIPEIPPSRPARAPAPPDATAGTMPAPSPSRARSGGAGVNPAPATQEPVYIEHAPITDRARARSQAKSIRDPRMRELAGRAIVAGWNLAKTGSGHWKLTHGSDPGSLVFGQTPSDHRAWMNVRARARRLGLDVEGIS